MSNKKLLAISGSPHLSGTTASMLDVAIRSAQKAGYEVTRVNLYDKNISFCKGCRVCLKTRRCIQSDDIQPIAQLLKECTVVILATPVYWANVPAIVKNLFDRLLGVAMEETSTFPKPHLSSKKYMLLTACNTPFPFSWIFGQSRFAIRSMNEFFKTSGMKCICKVVCSNTSNRSKLPKSLISRIEKCSL